MPQSRDIPAVWTLQGVATRNCAASIRFIKNLAKIDTSILQTIFSLPSSRLAWR